MLLTSLLILICVADIALNCIVLLALNKLEKRVSKTEAKQFG